MTFDDDHIQLQLSVGRVQATCRELGLSWPPPERIAVLVGEPLSAFAFRRIRYSQLTDDERQKLTHVCRGAEYERDPGQRE